MSHAAMTSGLEWNLKVTSQELGCGYQQRSFLAKRPV
jgi:hypothetical protein